MTWCSSRRPIASEGACARRTGAATGSIWGAHVFSGPDSATGRLLSEVGVEAVPVPGELAALSMNGRLLTDGRVETYPFRIPMPWRSRLALMRSGAKVRLAVRRYGQVCVPRPGDSPGELQQRVYEFMGEQSFADFVGPLPEDADAMFRPTVMRSAGSPEQVSAGAGVGYFRLVWDRRSGLSRNILGGPSTLTEAIRTALFPRVRTGTEVTEVLQSSSGVTVRYRDGSGTSRDPGTALCPRHSGAHHRPGGRRPGAGDGSCPPAGRLRPVCERCSPHHRE